MLMRSLEVGDVIGVYLHLIAEKPTFLRQSDRADLLEVSQGSYIKMTINGIEQPVTFLNIYEGHYHAAVSLFMNARCSINYGPNF